MGIGIIAQSILGVVIDRLFSPNRKSIPWYDKAHWYLGRGLFLFSFITIIFGFILYKEKAGSLHIELPILYSILLFFGIVTLLFGQFKLKPVGRV